MSEKESDVPTFDVWHIEELRKKPTHLWGCPKGCIIYVTKNDKYGGVCGQCDSNLIYWRKMEDKDHARIFELITDWQELRRSGGR